MTAASADGGAAAAGERRLELRLVQEMLQFEQRNDWRRRGTGWIAAAAAVVRDD